MKKLSFFIFLLAIIFATNSLAEENKTQQQKSYFEITTIPCSGMRCFGEENERIAIKKLLESKNNKDSRVISYSITPVAWDGTTTGYVVTIEYEQK